MMNETRVIFFGTTDFATEMLRTLVDDQYHVVAVVSQPDRPQGRKMKIVPTPVHAYCVENKLICLQPEKLKEAMDEILSYDPELIVTCAYGQFIPSTILDYPKYGCVNIHPSLLPKYRGGAPIHHAIWSGDEETGVCLMEMTKAMDAGRVYARVTLPIGPDETTEELTPRLMVASKQLLHDALPDYIQGNLPGVPQGEESIVIAPNISKEDEFVHFQTETLDQAYNHIRALIDWPVPYGKIDDKRMKFFKARKEICDTTSLPGTVIGFQDHAMIISCQGGVIKIYELQPEGSKRMNADAFANGAGRHLIGHRFE